MSASEHIHDISSGFNPISASLAPSPAQQFDDDLIALVSSLQFGHDNVFKADAKHLQAVSSKLKLGFGDNQNFLTSHQLAQLLKTALGSGLLDKLPAKGRESIKTVADYLSILNHVKSGQLGFDASCKNKGSTISNPSLQSAIAAMAIKDLAGVPGNTLSTSDQSKCGSLMTGIANSLKSTLGTSKPSTTTPASSDNPPSTSPSTSPSTLPTGGDSAPTSSGKPLKFGGDILKDLFGNPSGDNLGLFKASADAIDMTRKSNKKENSDAILNKKHQILSALAGNRLITLEKNSDGSINTEKTLDKIPSNSTAGFVMSLFFMEGIKRDDLKDGGDAANGYLNISEVVYRMAGFAGTPSELAQKAKNSGPIEAVNVLNKALLRATEFYGNTKDGIEMILRGIRGGGSGALMPSGTDFPDLGKLNELRMADNFQTNKYIKVFMQHWASILDDPTLMYNDVRLWDDVPYV